MKYQTLGLTLKNAPLDENQALFNANRRKLNPKILTELLSCINKLKQHL